MSAQPRKDRLHGRVTAEGRQCAEPGCDAPGEFRAPPPAGHGQDGPGSWRWLCLDHIRAFNAGYNYFAGMSAEEIQAAQHPVSGWERETRAFRADHPPRWADFTDPLDTIGGRFRATMAERAGRSDGKPLSPQDRDALKVLALDPDASRHALRRRYSELVRRYHPDRNGGDRSQEQRLRQVIEAYQHLRRAPAFA